MGQQGPGGGSPHVTISLSGGGYRAAAFGAGALLAIADSPLRANVVLVSSVSGGSIASALTVGGFASPKPAGDDTERDSMAQRVRIIAGILQTPAIFVQRLVSWGKVHPGVDCVCGRSAICFPQILQGSWPWRSVYVLGAFLFAVPLYILITAVPTSRVAIQEMIEAIVSQLVSTTTAPVGVSMVSSKRRAGTRMEFQFARELGAELS